MCLNLCNLAVHLFGRDSENQPVFWLWDQEYLIRSLVIADKLNYVCDSIAVSV